MAYLCEIEPFSLMPSYAFEVVVMISGYPFPSMYPPSWAHDPKLRGASRVVIREYPDEISALKQTTLHEQAIKMLQAGKTPSDIWLEFCPNEFRTGCRGGADVRFIGLADHKTWALFSVIESSRASHWGIPSRHC